MPAARSLVSTGVLLAALLMVGATSHAQAPQHLVLRLPGSAATLQVTQDSLLGPEVQLTRYGDRVRGRISDQIVSLRLGKEEVGGVMGSELTRLKLERGEKALLATGLFSGRVSRLALSKEQLTGVVGNCSYDLKLSSTSADTYEGSATCGGLPQSPVSVTLPPNLVAQGEAMTVVALALLLGS